MKRFLTISIGLLILAALAALSVCQQPAAGEAAEQPSAASPDDPAVERARKLVGTLDNIYKQTIVLITDKYVHDEDDFPAGSAAVLLFENISKSGNHQVRLIDASGEPYKPTNVARDAFETEGIARLKAGAPQHEAVVEHEGRRQLRTLTPVPVVMDKCILCHPHYADAKKGEPIGAISYIVPIE